MTLILMGAFLFLVLTDDDLPYVPGEEEPYSPVDEDVPNLSDDMSATSNIHQQMEELTRKIEKEKLVIQILKNSQKAIIGVDVSIILQYLIF